MTEGEQRRRPGTGPAVVYDGLRRSIIEQTLQPGARLAEDAVALQFGVSRTVVRSALDRLTAEGLVTRANNRSARVASPSLEECADLFDLRVAVEGLVVQRLAGVMSEDQASRLLAHVECEQAARGDNRPEAIRLAGEFHILLAELTGSAALTRSVSDLVSRCSLVLTGTKSPHSSECAIDDHLHLVQKLRCTAGKGASALMTRHLHSVLGRASLPRRIASKPTPMRDRPC